MDPKDFNKIKHNHDAFKEKGIWWLKDRGFTVEPYGYEDVLNKEIQDLLRRDESSEAMEIRHWPDTKVIKNGFECLIDWKTQYKKRSENSGSNMQNLAIDAIPFYHDYKLTDGGNLVMIAYHDIFNDIEKGFFVNRDWLPWIIYHPIRNGQLIQPKQCKDAKEYFDEIGREIGRKIKYIEKEIKAGSGEPYILIPGTKLEKLQNWKGLLP